jgi:hypothetical protein
MEKMYAGLWESDRIAKSEREEHEEKNLIERNRECLKVGTSSAAFIHVPVYIRAWFL